VDAIRRAKARREEQLRLVDDEAEEKAINLPAGSESSPELAAEHRLLEQQVQGVLSRMPDDRRRAVALYLEGMTTQEIADICGWTEPKARNLAYRGLKVLRKDLRDMGIKC
jgi:RNA polymerase sigma factor (sigma-70 family)